MPIIPVTGTEVTTGAGQTSHLELSYYFTSESEMDRLFSESGVDTRINDLNSAQKSTSITELAARATEDVQSYLGALYDDQELSNSAWVRDRATVIACYKLSIRLGNDAQYYNQYLDALADLEAARDGLLLVPGAAQSTGTLAEFANVSTDMRFPFRPIRVDTLTSTVGLDQVDNPKLIFPYMWF